MDSQRGIAMTEKPYLIDATVVPEPADGWESSGRQVPSFHIMAVSADAAVAMVHRIFDAAHPGIRSVTVTAVHVGGDGTPEFAMQVFDKTGKDQA